MRAVLGMLLVGMLAAIPFTSSARPQLPSPTRSAAKQDAGAVRVAPTEAVGVNRSAEDESVEVQLLRARLDDETRNNSAILQTVYWSLGVLVALALALIGFGWFANFRVYERDKAALAESLRGDLKSGLSSAEASLTSRFEDLRKTLSEATERARIESREEIRSSVNERTSGIDRRLKSITDAVTELRLDHELDRAELLFSQGYHGNGFTSYANALVIAEQLGRDYQVNSILSQIEKQIRNIREVYPSDVMKLSSVLRSLKTADPIQVERLSSVLRDAPPPSLSAN